MVDGREGVTAADEHVADLARRHANEDLAGRSTNLKASIKDMSPASEFHALGHG